MAISEWQMVPVVPTADMRNAFHAVTDNDTLRHGNAGAHWLAMLSAAPEPPHISMTREEAQTFQNWAGMDGACAFHLIERHANGWVDVARMMDAWLQANSKTHNVRANRTSGAAQE